MAEQLVAQFHEYSECRDLFLLEKDDVLDKHVRDEKELLYLTYAEGLLCQLFSSDHTTDKQALKRKVHAIKTRVNKEGANWEQLVPALWHRAVGALKLK